MAQRGRPDGVLDGVALWCPTLLGISRARGLGERDGRHGELVVFSGLGWLSRLMLWHDEVDEDTRDATRGLELSDPRGLSPWHSLPLSTLITRLETPWLDEALSSACLELHLQPLLWLEKLAIVGFEALARSRAAGRTIGGGELVRAAAAHEKLIEMERKCLEVAIGQSFPKLRENESLFVNMLPSSFGDADAFEQLHLRPLARKNIDFSKLVFEIIEIENLPPLREVAATVERIRAYGAMVAVDDLGTGSAAITHILDLEPDVVKLDRSLVQVDEVSACGIIQSLTACAHSVGALVVVEGIETSTQFEMARDAGADMGQGWYIGRPALEPPREFGERPFLG
jgi:EAL domain-containing protein (putative c-di-GMP-specific phosphodiesterase class I)